MTLYRVALRMAHDNTWSQRRKWSNTFWLEAANAPAAAAAIAGAWVSYLSAAAMNTVFAYEAYATDSVPETEDYAIVAIPAGNQRGLINPSPVSQPYLLKACASIDFNVFASRPSRKFWRPGLYEAYVSDGVALDNAITSAMTDAFTDFLDALSGSLRDPDGQSFSGIGKIRLTTRSFGRTAGSDLPEPPAYG